MNTIHQINSSTDQPETKEMTTQGWRIVLLSLHFVNYRYMPLEAFGFAEHGLIRIATHQLTHIGLQGLRVQITSQ
jgi:hypothetical protein